MTVGYPDYARVTQAGGFLLYSGNGSIPENTVLFQGYVGNWPYVNVFASLGVSADFAEIVLAYCSDHTLNTIVGFRFIVRAGTNFASTQYANLTPWVKIYYVTQSGSAMPFNALAIYATTGRANQWQLISGDVPLFLTNASVAAATATNTVLQHIQPGPAALSLNMDATSWEVQVQYYDYPSGSYLLLTRITSTSPPPGGVCTIGLTDTPINVFIKNNDASARFMRMSIVGIE